MEVQTTNKDMLIVTKDQEIQAYIVLRSQYRLVKTKQKKLDGKHWLGCEIWDVTLIVGGNRN